MDEGLLRAYGQTLFVADVPSCGHVCIRIGEKTDLMDELLDSTGASTWAFITASNPASIPLTPQDNQDRNVELGDRIASLGLTAWPGVGQSQHDDWPPEESLLVLGVDRNLAVQLGREFGQFAIVVGVRGGPAELVDCIEGSEGTS